MKELAVAGSVYDEVQQQGGEIVVITPDQPDALKKIADKFELKYPMLADPEFKAIDAYQLRHKEAVPGKDSARPAVFFVRADGTVSSSLQPDNYRLVFTADDLRAGFKQATVTLP
ncbi:MAG: redoxin domain-containing protein [Planctomycetes bacterium]|nr:redoxin domain-containing protein [Planctomycetota bacterium]